MKDPIKVSFARHIPDRQIDSIVSSIAAYGNVHEDATSGEFLVEVFRLSKRPALLTRLMEWERYGFLTYATDQ